MSAKQAKLFVSTQSGERAFNEIPSASRPRACTPKEKPQEGEVVAVGTGVRGDDGSLVALDVKAGDRVLFGKWSGTEVNVGGEELLIMKESDILGVVEA